MNRTAIRSVLATAVLCGAAAGATRELGGDLRLACNGDTGVAFVLTLPLA